MVEMPKRIWMPQLDEDDAKSWLTKERESDTEYVRADLVRESLGIAELEDAVLDLAIYEEGTLHGCIRCKAVTSVKLDIPHKPDCIVKRIQERRAVREGGEL